MRLIPNYIYRRISQRPNLLKIADNMSWLFFDRLVRMGIGLIVSVWVARYLGAAQFGMLSFATAFVAMFGAIAGLGLQGIVVRDIVRDPACKEKTLGTVAVLQFLGGVSAYLLVLVTIHVLRPNDPLSKLLVAILGMILMFKPSEIAVYWFESQVKSRYTVWVQNGGFLIFALVKVFLILGNAPLIAFALAIVAEALVVAVFLLLVLEMRGLKLSRLRFTLERSKELVSDGWPLLLSGLAVVVYMKIDQVMLGYMMDDEAVGIYSAAVRISEVWYFVPMVIVGSVFPSIMAAKKENESLYYGLLQRLFDLMVWLSISVALPMTFLSTSIVTLLFGDEYSASGPVLAIHIWASVFVFLGVASNKWFIVENRQFLSFQRTGLGAVINFFLNLVLIPILGVLGAAIATIISYGISAFLGDAMSSVTKGIFVMKLKSLCFFSLFLKLK